MYTRERSFPPQRTISFVSLASCASMSSCDKGTTMSTKTSHPSTSSGDRTLLDGGAPSPATSHSSLETLQSDL